MSYGGEVGIFNHPTERRLKEIVEEQATSQTNNKENLFDPLKIKKHETIKIALASTAFSLMVFAYSMIKAVKDATFLSMVGTKYQPWAKLIVIASSIAIFMPIYSFLMSRYSRKTVATLFPCIYAVFFIIFGALLIHPTIGLANATTSPFRITGWFSYVFLEFYSVAILATFWALMSSISTPKSSKNQYGIIAIASRVAGIIASVLGLYLSNIAQIRDTVAFPVILLISALSLVLAAILLNLMFKVLPKKFLTGYTDLHENADQKGNSKPRPKSFVEGLKCVLTEPYAIGIFGMIASIEIISTIMDYRMQCLISMGTGNSAMGMLQKFFVYTLSFQIVGLFLASFATTTLPKKIGVKKSLLITPIALMIMIVISFGFDCLAMAMAVQIAVRAFNYGFNEPVREMLYVPASRNIQFVAKGWVDTFGKTLSKGSAAGFNILAARLPAAISNIVTLLSAMSVGIVWVFIVLFVGKKYHFAVKEDKVIGNE